MTLEEIEARLFVPAPAPTDPQPPLFSETAGNLLALHIAKELHVLNGTLKEVACNLEKRLDRIEQTATAIRIELERQNIL